MLCECTRARVRQCVIVCTFVSLGQTCIEVDRVVEEHIKGAGEGEKKGRREGGERGKARGRKKTEEGSRGKGKGNGKGRG